MSAVVQTASRHQKQRVLGSFRVRVESELNQLNACYLALGLANNTLYSPAFFLASVSARTWNPAVIVIQNDNRTPVGILYTKERKVMGWRTGLYFADATLGSLISSDGLDEEQAFWAGMTNLLESGQVRGLRLLAPPCGHEVALLGVLARKKGFEFRTVPTESHVVLELTATYEEFLTRLGSKTRRNFRYYRNRSENAGHEYVENLSLEEFSPAAWNLEAQAPTGGDREGLRRALKMFKAAQKPLLVGLKSPEGEILSLLGGWYEDKRVVIFMQLNSDKRHAKYSLSLVLRAHLIESLIRQKCSEIVWWAGVGEPISNYCVPVPSAWVYLDRPDFVWRTLRALIDRHRHRMPARFRFVAEWLVPPQAKFAQCSAAE
jgi:hypothetical protein